MEPLYKKTFNGLFYLLCAYYTYFNVFDRCLYILLFVLSERILFIAYVSVSYLLLIIRRYQL